MMRKSKTVAAVILSVLLLGTALVPVGNNTVSASGTALFDTIQGVRWKPKLSGRDEVLNKVPYTGGAVKLTAVNFVDDYTQYATIDVTPINKLLKMGMTQQDAEDWKEQQYTEIANFVENVQSANMQFFLHSRVNSKTEFQDDMVNTLAAIRAKGLGNQIKGIMIGEHQKADPDTYLQLALDIADNINSRTGNWLKNGKALTLHGGRFGADFSGIKTAVENSNFFSQMSGKVSNFSFAFKYFDANTALVPGSGDLSDVNVWENYLNSDLGLHELKLVLDEYISAYPNHAHAIFVGDASDGLFTIKTKSYGDTLIDALQNIFAANGWEGFIFGQPFDYRDLTETDKRGMWKYQSGAFSSQTPLDGWQDWQSHM